MGIQSYKIIKTKLNRNEIKIKLYYVNLGIYIKR